MGELLRPGLVVTVAIVKGRWWRNIKNSSRL